ncbi:MAG: post-PEP-CTERM-1 domain-containing protein [Candidatus Krumholzibacteriia bacterium]
MSTSRNRLLWGLFLLLPLAGLTAGPLAARADEPAAAAAPSPTVAPAPPPAAGGMIVARDPETGALTLPTPEQRRELLPEQFGAALQSVQPLFEEAAPGGGYMIRLDGLLMDYALVTRDANGTLHLSCVHDPAAANRPAPAGAGVPAVSPAPEVE